MDSLEKLHVGNDLEPGGVIRSYILFISCFEFFLHSYFLALIPYILSGKNPNDYHGCCLCDAQSEQVHIEFDINVVSFRG